MADVRNTTAWQNLRARHLAGNPQCVMCGHTGSEDNPLQVDHIAPVSKFPDLALDPTNLQTLCRVHNVKKLDKEQVRVTWRNPRWFD